MIDPEKELGVEIIIKGTGLEFLHAAKNSACSTITSIKLSIRVKYPSRRGCWDFFDLPIITNGNASDAFDSLNQLKRQRAISATHCYLVDEAINRAISLSVQRQNPC